MIVLIKRYIWPVLRLLGYAGTFFMAFALFDGLIYMALCGKYCGDPNILNHFTTRAFFVFIWGDYWPAAYNVVIFSSFFFLFYKKFWWKSIYMFLLVWGAEDVLFNLENSIVNLAVFHGVGFFYGSPFHYFSVIGIDICAVLIGWTILRPDPRLDFSFSFLKYFGLTFLAITTAHTELLGLQGYVGFDILPNFISAMSNIGFLMFIYSVVTPKPLRPQHDVL